MSDEHYYFDVEKMHDYITAHGLGEPTLEGMNLAHYLVNTGDDYATAAHEVVARGMTYMDHEKFG